MTRFAQRRRSGRWMTVGASALLACALLACQADVEPADCTMPQDARQRFLTPGAECDDEARPRRLGYAWNGYVCGPILDGDCRHDGCEGSGCDALYGSLASCKRAHKACEGSCGARAGASRDVVPTHPICRVATAPATDRPSERNPTCRRDEDCRSGVNGRCGRFFADQVSNAVCNYDECFTDEDCPDGRVCAPLYDADPTEFAQSNLHCLRAACASSADCADGHPCMRRLDRPWAGFSPTPDDYHYACGRETCDPNTPIERYRVTSLTIPTRADVTSGAVIGLDIDGADDYCDVADYPGSVDNGLIELNAALLELDSPLDLQAEIDAALACAAPSASCTPLDLFVAVQRCDRTIVVMWLSGTEEWDYGTPALLDGSNAFRVELPRATLRVPVRTSTGGVLLNLSPLYAIVTGTLAAGGIDDMVIAGSMHEVTLQNSFAEVVPQLDAGPSVDEVEAILEGRNDVPDGGDCRAVTSGFRSSATLVP